MKVIISLLLFSCFVLSAPITVAWVDNDGDYEYDYVFQTAVAVEEVTINEQSTTFLEAAISGVDMVILFGLVDDTFVSPLSDFANTGGVVLLTGYDIMPPASAANIVTLLGANSYNDGSCFDNSLSPFSSDPVCAPMMDGGFRTLAGLTPNKETYYTSLDYMDNYWSEDCLVFDAVSTGTSCFTDVNSGSSIFAAKSYANGGGIYYMSSYFVSSFNTGFFNVIYNNLLMHTGATLPDRSGYPDIDVLIVYGDDDETDDEDYYFTYAFEIGAISSATFIEGTIDDLFDFDVFPNYDMIIVHHALYYAAYDGINNDLGVNMEGYANGGGVLLVTGETPNYDDFDGYQLLGFYYDYNCGGLSTYNVMDNFPTISSSDDNCNALLSGGFQNLSGLDPLAIEPTILYSNNNELECVSVSTASKCMSASQFADYKYGYPTSANGVWTSRAMMNGGAIVWMNDNDGLGSFSFTRGVNNIGLNNLLVYSATRSVCSLGTGCFLPKYPVANTEWTLYFPACIVWDPSDMLDTTVTLTLVNRRDRDTQEIIANLDSSLGYYEWPVVYGIIPGDYFSIEYSFDNTGDVLDHFQFDGTFEIQVAYGESLPDNTCTFNYDGSVDDDDADNNWWWWA